MEDNDNNDQQGKYTGPERRVNERRCGRDRRQTIRFCVGKSDRRGSKDRRRYKGNWNTTCTV